MVSSFVLLGLVACLAVTAGVGLRMARQGASPAALVIMLLVVLAGMGVGVRLCRPAVRSGDAR